MVRLIGRVFGVGVETADMLVNEIFSRHWRDRKAVARYAALTGSPDESGGRRRERGLARAGNIRVCAQQPIEKQVGTTRCRSPVEQGDGPITRALTPIPPYKSFDPTRTSIA
jgi:hypothetical protein